MTARAPLTAKRKSPTAAECRQLADLFDSGRHAKLESRTRVLLSEYPNSGFLWKALGAALQMQGRDSLPALQKAAQVSPGDAEAHNNLGFALQERGQFDDAAASCRRALQVEPGYAEAHSNLGNVLRDLGLLDEAVASHRRAVERKPDYAKMHNNLLFALNYHPDKSGEEIFAAYREFNTRIGLPCRLEWRPHSNSRDIKRRLKVGYVSPDFRRHSVRHFLEPLLASHDKDEVEVFAYADLAREDAVTQRYQGYVDHWAPTIGMTDAVLAERIRSDGIDILVDLAGHTAKNRLGVFARKPAPVSLHWLDFGYTTGLSAIDYYLTDEYTVPHGSEHLFSEQPWRLAPLGLVYRPAEEMGPVNALPALDRGHVTFGTLTRSVRINYRSIRAWAAILNRVPNSRLMVASSNFKDAGMQQALAEKFAACGISRERLDICSRSPSWDVLREMDISLDCFPHNSGTTLIESLYMGAPFVTLAGRASIGRLGHAILQAAGHPEWIAGTEDEYVEKAVALASDLPKLAALRAGLRGEMEASPLMDEPGFARKVEQAYREMFGTWSDKNS